MRETLLGWDGYKIMTMSLKHSPSGDVQTGRDMRNGKQMLSKWNQEMVEYRSVLANVYILQYVTTVSSVLL